MKRKNTFMLAILGIFIAGGVLSYLNILTSFFLSDDFSQIGRLVTFGPWRFFLKTDGWGFYRPLYFMSLYIDYMLWGLNPIGYHIINVILHALNAFLIFRIALLLLEEISPTREFGYFAALGSGFFFLVLPSHTEAVTWISCRADVLATLFALISFVTYLYFRRLHRLDYFMISLVLFACALFTKESTVMFPLFIFFYELYRLYADGRGTVNVIIRLSSALAYLLILFLYLSARYSALGKIIGGYGTEQHVPHNIVHILNNIVIFSARVLLPPMRALKAIFAIICIVLLWLWYGFRKNPALSLLTIFLLGSLLLFLLPVIGLSMNYAKDTQGERFVYLPSVFIVMFVIFVFYYVLRKRVIILLIVSFCVGIFYTIMLWKTNQNWVKAANISKNIVCSLQNVPKSNEVLFLSLPDNINGAYIFRNGIYEAVGLFVGRNYFKRIHIVSKCDISSENDGIAVTNNRGNYNIRLISRNGYLKKINYDYCSRVSATSFIFDKAKVNPKDLVIFYASGKAGMRIAGLAEK